MEQNKHRTWAEINLQALRQNFIAIQKQAGGTKVLCVIKANAYGHGSVQVAKCLEEEGAAYFAVATVQEALELRENGVRLPILLLGYIDASDAREIARHDLTAPVYDRETALLLSAAAVKEGRTITAHFQLDTGMTRLGFDTSDPQNAAQEMREIARLPGLQFEGAFTHFAVSDDPSGGAYTDRQFARFMETCDALEAGGVQLRLRHCANSGGILYFQKAHLDMVRAGIILYGYPPSPALPDPCVLRPVMTLKARVAQVRQVEAGTPVSYGCTYRPEQDTRLAVLTIGYADGYLRTASGKAQVLLHGRQVPVVGRICMDMCMAQLPEDLPVRRGDEAVIFGEGAYTADNAAAAAGTISYEVLCAVAPRVPRFYVED